jgi:hypothetical protein
MRNALKSAAWTILWTTLVPFLLSGVGWLNDCIEWAADMANGGEQSIQFPDPSVLFGLLLGFVFSLVAASSSSSSATPRTPTPSAVSPPRSTGHRSRDPEGLRRLRGLRGLAGGGGLHRVPLGE